MKRKQLTSSFMKSRAVRGIDGMAIRKPSL